ncbi:MAG: trypsin-like peptidase domain-containing protein [Oscillospiraceae bacterium]|jgi:S1-C subfamily serine protease|nr:trypsin-like peptidase domain-containing protein [Oscillospiraceae bacterium]
MKKRILAALFCLALAVESAFAASLSNFTPSRDYRDGQFTDVAPSDWFANGVAGCYELGLVDGDADGAFNPLGYLTIADSVKLAANLRSIYETGAPVSPGGEIWYEVYVNYLASFGVIERNEFADYTARAARSDFAKILARALPEEAITPVNLVPDGAVPDVAERYSYGGAVYALYRAGIFTGGGAEGEFYPNMPVTRAEAATAVLRAADPTQRAMIQRAGALTAEQIYEKCAPAVFYIEVFKDGEVQKQGSGFFIEENGVAVTNSHVIAGAESAKATLSTGETVDITGIYGYDMTTDCALIQVDGEGFPTLEVGDYEPKTGAEVFTIGNPIGLINSFSRGIVSTAKREIDGMRYIQIDAAISAGSSGGALLDAAGRVVGITSAGMTGGQSLNLAMPIGAVRAISTDSPHQLGGYPEKYKLYEGHFPVPDFGAYANIEPSRITEFAGSLSAVYDISGKDEEALIAGYTALLAEYSFAAFDKDGERLSENAPRGVDTVYYNALFDVEVSFKIERRGDNWTALTIDVY